ncbi:hypothetical protein A5798_000054, partial [Enterococcus sp. 6C8_DIV0013]
LLKIISQFLSYLLIKIILELLSILL